MEEVHAVRRGLGLDRVHLFGHSWGGWLAIEYMLSNPPGVERLLLASTSSSLPEAAREIGKLKAALPSAVLDTLERHEKNGDYHHPEYEAAAMEFYKRHVCRLDPWPEPLLRSLSNMTTDPVAYETIQGPNEFTINGNLKDWDRTSQLDKIRVPTLVTVGRHDEIGPACARTIHQGIIGSRLEVFERSSHMAMWEETERYLREVGSFLKQ